MARPRLLNLVRNRHNHHAKLIENEDSDLHSPVSTSTSSSNGEQLATKCQQRRRGFKSGNGKIFRRITSRRSLKRSNNHKDGLVKEKAVGPQPSRTFSMSEDDASHVSSLLFSPVNNPMMVCSSENASSSSQHTVVLSSPISRPDFPPFFISRHERLLKKYKLKLADAIETVETKDAEIECLKQLAEDAKELQAVEMELKNIVLEKKDVEVQKLETEIARLKAEMEEQSKIIEVLATSQHEKMNCNWFATLPNLFMDLI